MGKIDESGADTLNWNNSEVYQIEENDPVQGGANGISNKQAKELAKRTSNLNLRVADIEMLVRENPDGVVNTLVEMINAFKAFPEGEQALANALASKATKTELASALAGKANKNGDINQSFDAFSIQTKGDNNLMTSVNEFNFIGSGYNVSTLFINYKGAAKPISTYYLCNGQGSNMAGLVVKSLKIVP